MSGLLSTFKNLTDTTASAKAGTPIKPAQTTQMASTTGGSRLPPIDMTAGQTSTNPLGSVMNTAGVKPAPAPEGFQPIQPAPTASLNTAFDFSPSSNMTGGGSTFNTGGIVGPALNELSFSPSAMISPSQTLDFSPSATTNGNTTQNPNMAGLTSASATMVDPNQFDIDTATYDAAQVGNAQAVDAAQADVTGYDATQVGDAATYDATLVGDAAQATVTEYEAALAADPERAETEVAEAITRQVQDNELSQVQLEQMLASDSPLMRRAAAQGMQMAASRGLLNSSFAAGAAQGAMIDRAQAFAINDANTFANTASENMQAENQAEITNANNITQTNMFNAGEANETSRFNANAENAASQFNAGAQNEASIFNTSEQNQNSRLDAQSQNEADRFNTGEQNQNTRLDAQFSNEADRFNAQASNEASIFNTGQQNEANIFNASEQNQNERLDTQSANQAAQFNASEENANSRTNAQIQSSIAQQNAALETDLSKFNASESNKAFQAESERDLKRELQSNEFEFMEQENALDRTNRIDTANISASATLGAANINADSRLEVAQLNNDARALEAEASREFTASQNDLSRQFQASESQASRDFQSSENATNRDFQSTQADLDRAFQDMSREDQQAFQNMTREDQQAFNAEQNEIQREFQAENIDKQFATAVTSEVMSSVGQIYADPNLSATQKSQAAANVYNQAKDMPALMNRIESSIGGDTTPTDAGSTNPDNGSQVAYNEQTQSYESNTGNGLLTPDQLAAYQERYGAGAR